MFIVFIQTQFKVFFLNEKKKGGKKSEFFEPVSNPGFPRLGGGRQLQKWGVTTYYLANFVLKISTGDATLVAPWIHQCFLCCLSVYLYLPSFCSPPLSLFLSVVFTHQVAE